MQIQNTFHWFEVAAMPKPMLLFFLFGAITVDFITGLIKSWTLGKATTSIGFRKTVSKLSTYVGAIIGIWFLANLFNMMYETDYSLLVNGALFFLSFIELYSVFENLYQIAPKSLLSIYFIKPILKFLKGKLENNHPIKNIEDGKEN